MPQNAVPALTTIMVVLISDVLFITSIVFYAYGINQYNIDYKFTSLHAEVDAVTKLKSSEKCKKVTMVVFRVNNSGTKLCMAKPCKNCINTIKSELKQKNYKLKGNRCWYTDEAGNFSYIKIYSE
jgi:hypothetical protein